ncbi:hypothetical protein [Lentzea sp.]|uniref:hypothetical protein n=1 Tax=Lentzea sp. TaxID=56099 RepID=UPI002ED1D471
MKRLLVVTTAVVAAVAGCSPPPPVAVRETATGSVEIVYTDCDTPAIVRVEAVTSQDASIDDGDPRIWHVDHVEPVHDKVFVIDAKIEPGQVVWVGITLEGGVQLGADFTPEDLAGGKVRFHDENMSAEDFAKTTSCG